jgi:hypothetical protein
VYLFADQMYKLIFNGQEINLNVSQNENISQHIQIDKESKYNDTESLMESVVGNIIGIIAGTIRQDEVTRL